MPANRAVLVRHGDDPPDDRVVTYMLAAGYRLDIRRPCFGESLGECSEDVAALVLYGGPYNVFETDEHPFLDDEYAFLDAALERGIPVLGICQGAQMIAYHRGGWAGDPGNDWHEFGYYPITPSAEAGDFLEDELFVTQSHFHTFELPEGAERLAGNAAYPNQAFRIGKNVYGLQFHPEVTIEGFRRWQSAKPEVYRKRGVQDRDTQTRLMLAHDAAQAEWFFRFLNRLFPAIT